MNYSLYFSVNSPYGQCPLRFTFEKETDENSLREGQRLQAEAENIQSHFDVKSGRNIVHSFFRFRRRG